MLCNIPYFLCDIIIFANIDFLKVFIRLPN